MSSDNGDLEELNGLVSPKGMEIAPRSSLPYRVNILRSRLLLSLKSVDASKPVYKARFVVQGHRDIVKDMHVSNSSTARPPSTRLQFSVAGMR